MARVGKIAQCPETVRRELNRRLDDGQLSPQILEWVNGLPNVKTLLLEKFEGVAISPQNLSEWRAGGYADWQAQQESVERTKRMAEFSVDLAKASGGDLSEGAVAIRAGQILEKLETANEETRAALSKEIVSLRFAEIEGRKLKQTDKKIAQADRALDQEDIRIKRQTAELFVKYIGDVKAREIAEGKGSKNYKIESLIPILFGAPKPSYEGPQAKG